MRLPPLAVGFGSIAHVRPLFRWQSAFGRWLYTLANRHCSVSQQMGLLVASGLIVGESLFGVINAGLIVSAGHDAPLGVHKPFGAAR